MEVEGAGCKKLFFARGRWCRRHYQGVEVEGAGCEIFFLPGGGGAGGIIRGWGLRGQGAKILFCCQGEVVQEALSGGGGEKGEKGAGCKTTFPI